MAPLADATLRGDERRTLERLVPMLRDEPEPSSSSPATCTRKRSLDPRFK
jgi:hypothetical protein